MTTLDKEAEEKVRQIPRALWGVFDPKLVIPNDIHVGIDGTLHVKSSWSLLNLQAFGAIFLLTFIGFGVHLAILERNSDWLLWLHIVVYSLLAITWLIPFVIMVRVAWQMRFALSLSIRGIEHHAFGFVSWADVRDFRLLTEQRSRSEVKKLSLELRSNANFNFYHRIRWYKNFVVPCRIDQKNLLVELVLEHVEVNENDLYECARYFFYWHQHGGLPATQTQEEKNTDILSMPTGLPKTLALRTDAITRRLNALRRKRSIEK
jgi:hypothetical protein